MSTILELDRSTEPPQVINPPDYLDHGLAIENQHAKLQSILREIWNVIAPLYQFSTINSNEPEFSFQIPSVRFAELGLVSQKTGDAIKTRKGETNGRGDWNTFTITKVPAANPAMGIGKGFVITEKYVAESEYQDDPAKAGAANTQRVDTTRIEKTYLWKEGEEVKIKIVGKEGEPVLYAGIGDVISWTPKKYIKGHIDPEPAELAVTPRSINTTIAAVYEGLYSIQLNPYLLN